MTDDRLDELIDLHLSGAMDEATRAELEERLLRSPADCARFWELAETHMLLHEGLQQGFAHLPEPPLAPRSAWLQWRPLVAAAAGVILGCLSASFVWAYAVKPRSVTLLHESFESSAKLVRQDFPEAPGVWSVVGGHLVAAENGIRPRDGAGMLRLDAKKREKSTRAFYVVDLREFAGLSPAGRQQFGLSASFHSERTGGNDRYLLRAAAFGDDLAQVDLRWMRELWGEVQDHSLAAASRNLTVSPGTDGWKTLSLTLDVPAGAHILIISLWTATLSEDPQERGAHFVDDVRLTRLSGTFQP